MDRNDEHEIDRIIADRFSAFRPDSEWRPNLRRGLTILTNTRAKSHRRTIRTGALAAAIAAVSLPLMALPITRVFAERCVSACVQETAALRELLLGHSSAPSPSGTFVQPAERRSAPDFALTGESGDVVRLSDFRGKVILLNFWATWCTPCSQEIPWFREFERANKARGFEVIGISMDEGGWKTVEPYVRAKQINYRVAIGTDHIAALFGGLQTIPLTLVIDRQGRIAAIHAGLCRKDEYEGDIKALLNER